MAKIDGSHLFLDFCRLAQGFKTRVISKINNTFGYCSCTPFQGYFSFTLMIIVKPVYCELKNACLAREPVQKDRSQMDLLMQSEVLH